MKKKLLISMLFILLVLCWSQIGISAEKEMLKILGLRIGSSGHMFATKIADVINVNVPEVSMTIVTGSSKENPLNVQKKRGHIGFTSAQYAQWAYDGVEEFKDTPCKDIRHFFFFVITLDNWIVRADSPIRKIEDLKDKKICVGPKGYALTEGALTTLEAYGLTPDIIRQNRGNVSFAVDKDAVQMLQDRVIDAMFVHSGKSSVISTALPLEKTIGLRPLPYDRDKLETIVKKLGRGNIIMEIDGGVYKAEPNPVLSFGTPFIFVIHKELSEGTVYKMTKSIWEHQKEILNTVGPFYNPFKIENALLGAEIPVHSGALKYYKEVGIAK